MNKFRPMKNLMMRSLNVKSRKASLPFLRIRSFSSILEREFDNLVTYQKDSCKLFKDNKYLGTWNGEKFDFLTYGEFDKDVDQFRTALSQVGLTVDDKVALISNNRAEWAITYYAANGLGAQVVPLYEAQTEADWRYIIEHSEAKLLVVATEAIYNRTIKYIQEFENLETVICLDADVSAPYSYKHHMAAAGSLPITPPWTPTPEHLSAIVYTSGSTGNPKGVEIMHSNMVANLKGIAETLGDAMVRDAPSKTSVCYLPWSHIFGLTCSLHTSLGSGGSVALAPNREFILQSAEIIQPYEMSSVPILLNKIYAGVTAKVAEGTALRQFIVKKAFEIARKRNELVEKGLPVDPSTAWWFEKVDKIVMTKIRSQILGGKLEFLTAGGGKTSLAVLHFFEDIGLPLCEGYGMTECAPVITMSTSPGFERRRLGCVGKPIAGVSVTIRDPVTQVELPVGSEGEICVSGSTVTRGYYKNPEATAESYPTSPEGERYLRTGDLGSVDGDGYLKVSGRLKEQFKLQNGKFVSPSPIEDILQRSPYILQVAVFGADQEYNAALVVPDALEVERWAMEQHGLDFDEGVTSPEFIDFLTTNKDVETLITSEIKKYSSELKHYELLKKYVILGEPFSPENNLLTQKMSLKRHNVSKVYEETINKIFSGEIGYEVK